MIGEARGIAGSGLKMKPRWKTKKQMRLDRAKALILAAIRVWELKNGLQPEPWR